MSPEAVALISPRRVRAVVQVLQEGLAEPSSSPYEAGWDAAARLVLELLGVHKPSTEALTAERKNRDAEQER